MATKLKKVLKREVVTLEEGRRLGQPVDILFDPEQQRAATIVLTLGSVPETSVVADAGAVQSFETDTLALDRLDSLRIAANDETALRLLSQGLRLPGRPVLGPEGKRLGRIAQVLVDERGNVVEYRVRRRALGYLRPTIRIKPSELRTSGGELAVVERPSEGRGRDAS